MEILDIIAKKRDKKQLTKKEIEFIVENYVKGEVQEYQMSAFLMAVYLNGMTNKETFALSKAIQNSGETLNLKKLGITADKHSSGGVSDTTTIAIAPIVACAGIKMLKMSGRGLGFTGGTADKLEAFTGYNVDLSMEKARELTKKNGACLITQGGNLCIADEKMYALRDVTSTVESMPLIASSIMSKKLAGGTDIIVLDVKCGDGAFMKSLAKATKLAKIMVGIGKFDKKKIVAVITDMSQPLGYCVGDTLEVCEAIDVLKGAKNNLATLIKFFSAKIIMLGKNISMAKASSEVNKIISSGEALKKLETMVRDSGGETKLFTNCPLKPIDKIFAEMSGYISKIHAEKLGRLSIELGAGRKKLDDIIDHNVGFRTFVKVGDQVKKGDVLCEIFAKNKVNLQFKEQLSECFNISKNKQSPIKLIKKIIE